MNVIEFPGLGLKFEISRVAFNIPVKIFSESGIPIYWYGVIIAAGFMLAVLLALKDSRKFGFEQEHIIDQILFAAPVAIICARLYYVIFNFGLYRDNLLNVFNTREGGLAIIGGIIGALATAYVYCRIKKINVLNLFDFVMPYFAIAQAIGRWGNFVNQEAFGTNTTLPWGMTGDGIRKYLEDERIYLGVRNIYVNPAQPVHPTFLYESLWNVGVFLFLIWYRKRKKTAGEVFYLYMVLYGLGRAWIEALRTDSLYIGGLRVSQVLSVVFVLFFGAIFFMQRNKKAVAAEGFAGAAGGYGTGEDRPADADGEDSNTETAEEPAVEEPDSEDQAERSGTGNPPVS